MPTISVLMPVYNGEKYVKETIDSVLNQTYTDFEFIIVNDGSTDKTREIIEGYTDQRIKLYNLDKNRGVGFASNFAVNKAQGKYIARVDSDDIYHPDRLLLQKKFLDDNPDIALVKTFVEYFGDEDVKETERYNTIKTISERDKNNCVTPEDISRELFWCCCIPHTTIMVRTEVMKKFGYEDLRCCEDYNLFYKMNIEGYKMGTVAEHLARQRVSNSSITATNMRLMYENNYYIKKDIINYLFKNGEVYLWGAGSFGKLVREILENNGLKISGFIDSDTSKHKNKIANLEVHSPEILNKNIKVIVTSQPGRKSIVYDLTKKGYKHLEDYVVFM